jgi:hypothetical protein
VDLKLWAVERALFDSCPPSLIFVLDLPRSHYAFEEFVGLSFARPQFEDGSIGATSTDGVLFAWMGMGMSFLISLRVFGPGRAEGPVGMPESKRGDLKCPLMALHCRTGILLVRTLAPLVRSSMPLVAV